MSKILDRLVATNPDKIAEFSDESGPIRPGQTAEDSHDGYWIYLKAGWRTSSTDSHTVHEWTVAETVEPASERPAGALRRIPVEILRGLGRRQRLDRVVVGRTPPLILDDELPVLHYPANGRGVDVKPGTLGLVVGYFAEGGWQYCVTQFPGKATLVAAVDIIQSAATVAP